MSARTPCPECGIKDWKRAPGHICAECKRKIKAWEEHVKETVAEKEMVTVNLKGSYFWYPMFYFGEHGHNSELDELRDTIGRTFAELGPAVCKSILTEEEWRSVDPVPLYPMPHIRKNKTTLFRYPCSEGQSTRERSGLMTKEQLRLLQTLWDACARFTQLAYLMGVEEGRDCLRQLATGQMSVDDFQEESIRRARQVQDARELHAAVVVKRQKKGLSPSEPFE